MKKAVLLLVALVVVLVATLLLRTQKPTDNFRMALSVSPFTHSMFLNGYTYQVGNKTATTLEELERLYIAAGATEMYARIATKRYPTPDDSGIADSNVNSHTLEQGLALCRLAAKLHIPINPEIMCAYTYMDMETQQAPDFSEYPELLPLQNGKPWEELTLEEICTVLRAYGQFVATEILNTGCTVQNWNLGNEANFGFAGISVGLQTAVNPALATMDPMQRYMASEEWMEDNLWKYHAQALAALSQGIKDAYVALGKDDSQVTFSTHIATVVFPTERTVSYFNCLRKHGYNLDVAGISFYPSAPSAFKNSMDLYHQTVEAIQEQCHLPVFIAEFSYPSGPVTGAFAGWSIPAEGYEISEDGQAAIYADVITWGKEHGVIGIRYWAADLAEGWSNMSMFRFEGKQGIAKRILLIH
ncbi:MAG: glycosyl hydrolase 53 family protein [Bacteroidaceae bacterium]|jgi:hypothetical protein|nr:glycosyl hydrolase 53 family protein [Bacteroidaceae bacterium]MBQ9500392.1 glycosyl hydrolase 53 family protein [Bacteroidaceae bacterium]